jgi:uncharacterized caspase-like protein
MNARIKLVMLDACRSSPFSQGQEAGGRSLLGSNILLYKFGSGLAPIPVAENSETLISFATKDGKTASDGISDHSPYTEALLKHIDENVDVTLVLRRVRQEVLKLTNGEQQPWEYGSLLGEELVISKQHTVE